jgi:hypothetical protein
MDAFGCTSTDLHILLFHHDPWVPAPRVMELVTPHLAARCALRCARSGRRHAALLRCNLSAWVGHSHSPVCNTTRVVDWPLVPVLVQEPMSLLPLPHTTVACPPPHIHTPAER